MLVTPQNCTKMLRNLTFVSCTICSLQILASDQNKFLLFWATFEQLSLLTKSHFWLFFGQRFEKLRETSTTPQPPSVQHCQPPVSPKVMSISFFFFFFPFLSFSFFDGQFSYRLSRLCPDKLWAWCDVDPHHPHIHETDLIVKSVYT